MFFKYLRVLTAAIEMLPDGSIFFLILGQFLLSVSFLIIGNTLYCNFNVDHEIHFVKFLDWGGGAAFKEHSDLV